MLAQHAGDRSRARRPVGGEGDLDGTVVLTHEAYRARRPIRSLRRHEGLDIRSARVATVTADCG